MRGTTAIRAIRSRSRPIHWPSCRWCARSCSHRWLIFGHISLSQIKKTGEEGRGLAVAGLVISYLITVLTILVVVLSVVFIVKVANDLEFLDGLTPDYPDITAIPSPGACRGWHAD